MYESGLYLHQLSEAGEENCLRLSIPLAHPLCVDYKSSDFLELGNMYKNAVTYNTKKISFSASIYWHCPRLKKVINFKSAIWTKVIEILAFLCISKKIGAFSLLYYTSPCRCLLQVMVNKTKLVLLAYSKWCILQPGVNLSTIYMYISRCLLLTYHGIEYRH